MDRDVLFKTVLPMSGAIVIALAFVVGYMRWAGSSADRAHAAFESAMRAVVGRLGITYQPPSSSNDFPGAMGTHRGHRVTFFVVSQTESPMMTGLSVRLDSPLSAELLARLKARESILRRAKLEVRASGRSDVALPLQIGEFLDALIAPKDIYEIEIAPDQIVLTLQGRAYSFFNYNMLTAPDRLLVITYAALDLAVALERGVL